MAKNKADEPFRSGSEELFVLSSSFLRLWVSLAGTSRRSRSLSTSSQLFSRLLAHVNAFVTTGRLLIFWPTWLTRIDLNSTRS